MSLGIPLPDRVRRVRHVTVAEDLDVDVVDTDGEYFDSLLQPPAGTSGDAEGSPRSRLASKLFYDLEQDLLVADRVQAEADGLAYELTSKVRAIRVADEVMGYEVQLVKVADLYPRLAVLQEQDGTQVATDLRCSLFTAQEANAGRGTYENYRGEAPIEHDAALQEANRALVIGARKFRIITAAAEYEVPRVVLELRAVQT